MTDKAVTTSAENVRYVDVSERERDRALTTIARDLRTAADFIDKSLRARSDRIRPKYLIAAAGCACDATDRLTEIMDVQP